MPNNNENEWATIGKVVAPFGLRGEMKVFLLTDIPDRFGHLERVFVGAEHKAYGVQAVRPYKGDVVILKLREVGDATRAEMMRNKEITIPLSELASLPENAYYQHDILGMEVETVRGQNVGRIVDFIETGSNDVYVVEGAGGKQILIPAIKDVVKQVDLRRRMMYIDPIAGLWDDDETAQIEQEEDDQSVDSE